MIAPWGATGRKLGARLGRDAGPPGAEALLARAATGDPFKLWSDARPALVVRPRGSVAEESGVRNCAQNMGDVSQRGPCTVVFKQAVW